MTAQITTTLGNNGLLVPGANRRPVMLAILLALASAAGYGGSDDAGGLAARRGSVIRITILAQAVSAALMIFILPLAGLPAPLGGLAWGAVAGVGEAIGALALYAGFRNAAFSVAGPLSAVGSAGFSVLAGLLLGERPGTLAIVGIGLSLPAIIGVSVSPGSARPGRGRPGHAKPGRPEPPQLYRIGEPAICRARAGRVPRPPGRGQHLGAACRGAPMGSRVHRVTGGGRNAAAPLAAAMAATPWPPSLGGADRRDRRGRGGPVLLRHPRGSACRHGGSHLVVSGSDNRSRPPLPGRAAHRDQAGRALPGCRVRRAHRRSRGQLTPQATPTACAGPHWSPSGHQPADSIDGRHPPLIPPFRQPRPGTNPGRAHTWWQAHIPPRCHLQRAAEAGSVTVDLHAHRLQRSPCRCRNTRSACRHAFPASR